MEQFDVIILGGGAAGLSAGLYSTRAMQKTLILERLGYGGQILVTDMIENYPGFPEGIRGPELSIMMEQQTRRFGAEMRYEEVEGVENLDQPLKLVHTSEGSYVGKTIIIAGGGSHKKLGVPGEDNSPVAASPTALSATATSSAAKTSSLWAAATLPLTREGTFPASSTRSR